MNIDKHLSRFIVRIGFFFYGGSISKVVIQLFTDNLIQKICVDQ